MCGIYYVNVLCQHHGPNPHSAFTHILSDKVDSDRSVSPSKPQFMTEYYIYNTTASIEYVPGIGVEKKGNASIPSTSSSVAI